MSTTKLSKRSDPEEFPPNEMDLLDRWVVAIVESQISGEDRARRWPAAFSTKGLRATYVHKGQASKSFDNASKLLKYTVIFSQVNMFGQEAASFNLPERVYRTAHGGNQTELGLTTQVQSTGHDCDDAAAKATAARLAKL